MPKLRLFPHKMVLNLFPRASLYPGGIPAHPKRTPPHLILGKGQTTQHEHPCCGRSPAPCSQQTQPLSPCSMFVWSYLFMSQSVSLWPSQRAEGCLIPCVLCAHHRAFLFLELLPVFSPCAYAWQKWVPLCKHTLPIPHPLFVPHSLCGPSAIFIPLWYPQLLPNQLSLGNLKDTQVNLTLINFSHHPSKQAALEPLLPPFHIKPLERQRGQGLYVRAGCYSGGLPRE